MKRWIVGLLAAAALTGCGVGVDDPEGQAAAYGQTGQALVNGPVDPRNTDPRNPSDLGSSTTSTSTGQVQLTDPYLPQDPVPLLVMHPGVTQPGTSDPSKK